MRRLPPLVVCLLAAVVALVGLPRSPADEEEEVNPKKPAKRVVVDDDTPGGAGAIADLIRAASSTKHPGLKKFYAGTSVACDRITLENGKLLRVVPLPFVWEKDRDKFRANPDGFGAAALDDDNKAGEPQFILPKDVRAVTPFERFAVLEADKLVSSTATDAAPFGDRVLAAERVLTATLFAHDAAVAANRRRGPNWEPYKAAIVDKLLDVRLLMVRDAAQAKNWRRLEELVTRYSDLYRNKPKVLEVLVTLRLGEAAELAKSDDQASLVKARDLLSDFENKVPNSGNEQAKEVRAALAEKAKKLIDTAGTTGDKDRQRTLLNEAKQLNPDDPSVRAKQRELRTGYSALVVGVTRMPRLMSPATAREDSERMAVELVFESLLDPLPDEQYGRVFRPLLAAHKPLVSPLARELTLVGNAAWGRAGGGVFDAADLTATVQLMKAKRALPSAEAADWLADPVPDADDPNRVRVKLSSAHPDPRQVLAFKVLPGKHLLGKKKEIDDQIGTDSLARAPFGTGPYRLTSDFEPSPDDRPVKEISFVPNSGYRRRPGRFGEPEVSEIRFVPVGDRKPDDLVRDVAADQIHILPDVPTEDLEKFRTGTKAQVVTAANNRRVHILAVNHAVAALQPVDVRRGLSLAIDRETILNEVYRSGTKHHHALAGPFPTGSWLAPPAPKPLFDRDLAAGRLRESSGQVTLLYPNDDPRAEAVCRRIAAAVNEFDKLRVKPEGVSPVELRTRVEQQGRYELAYMPFDFPDIWHAHAVAACLDPTAAGNGGRNCFAYRTKGTVPSRADDGLTEALADLKAHRDTEGEIKKASREVYERFVDAMPFIPLWQLDRHMVISGGVKVYFDGRPTPVPYEQLDPITLFSNVSRWKLEEVK
jgi:peptide/nickel transport system substrate-binding protein